MAHVSKDLKERLVQKVINTLPEWNFSFSCDDSKTTFCVHILEIPKKDFFDMNFNEKILKQLKEKFVLNENEVFTPFFKLRSKTYQVSDQNQDRELGKIIYCFNDLFNKEKGDFSLLSKLVESINSENYDNSIVQADYFEVGYYSKFQFGKGNEPCKFV